jgi:LysM repeat protein
MTKQEKNNSKEVNLSNEFQKEIKERKTPRNWFVSSSLMIVSLIVLGSLVLGAYDIFFKSEKITIKNSSEKIESKPSEDKTKVKDKTSETTISATSVPPAAEEYVIVDGDNLGLIATKFGTTVEKLKSANNIQDETLLQIGQKIKIVK